MQPSTSRISSRISIIIAGFSAAFAFAESPNSNESNTVELLSSIDPNGQQSFATANGETTRAVDVGPIRLMPTIQPSARHADLSASTRAIGSPFGSTYSIEHGVGADVGAGFVECFDVSLGIDDDIVTFDGILETLDGLPPFAQTPLAHESEVPLAPGISEITIITSLPSLFDDLFPGGQTDLSTGTPLVDGCYFVGLTDPLDWSPQPIVGHAQISLESTFTGFGEQGDITSFFPQPWSGQVGVILRDGAGLNIDDIRLEMEVITSDARACTDLAGHCLGDVEPQVCVNSGGFAHPTATCGAFVPYLPTVAAQSTPCGFDNGQVLDGFAIPASQYQPDYQTTVAAADDFVIPESPSGYCDITNITAYVRYFNIDEPHTPDPAIDFQGINVTVYADSNGVPAGKSRDDGTRVETFSGGILYSGAVNTFSVSTTGLTPCMDAANAPSTARNFRIDISTIANDIRVPAGVRLWVEVQPIMNRNGIGQTGLLLSEQSFGYYAKQMFPKAGLPDWTVITGNTGSCDGFARGTRRDLALSITALPAACDSPSAPDCNANGVADYCDINSGPWVAWVSNGSPNRIQRANPDGSNVIDLAMAADGVAGPEDVAFDPVGGMFYWTNANADTIQRASVDGSVVEVVLDASDGLQRVSGVSIEPIERKLYWTDTQADAVRRADLDGSNIEDLVITGLDNPLALVLDPAGGKMYWMDSVLDKLMSADLYGSNIVDVVTTNIAFPVDLALDPIDQKLYWTDQNLDVIQRVDIDGSNQETILTTADGLSNPTGITVDPANGKIYWTDNGLNRMSRANLDGSQVETVITGLTNPRGMTFVARTSDDCDDNDVPDECESDCDGDGVIDACAISAGTSIDCDVNGIPDDCEPDCNANNVVDACDVTAGTSDDCQLDGIPDECQVGSHVYAYDDGTFESSGNYGSAAKAALQRFVVVEGTEVIDRVEVAWGGLGAGWPANIYVWSDPNGDGDPADAKVIATTATFSGAPGTFGEISIGPITLGSAGTSVFVGYALNDPVSAIPFDQDSPFAGEAWIVGATPSTFDPNDLANPNYILPLARVEETTFGELNLGIRAKGPGDCDSNGLPDACDSDCNDNGIPDVCEVLEGTADDCNENLIPDLCDLVSVPHDCCRPHPGSGCSDPEIETCVVSLNSSCQQSPWTQDCVDLIEFGGCGTCPSIDCDANGVPDECDPDCNDNGVNDVCETPPLAHDCCTPHGGDGCSDPDISACVVDQNPLCGGFFGGGWYQYCVDLVDTSGCGTCITQDCNANDIPDDCEIAAGSATDCDSDGLLDFACEGMSDCNGNGDPDECELEGNDCNINMVPDDCELTDNDCNTNGVPDDCEFPLGDCNANGVLDDCELAAVGKPLFMGLGDLPGGDTESRAYGVSSDGSVVVGFGHTVEGQVAMRWTLDEGMISLGDFPGSIFWSVAYGVSGDGRVIVGQGTGQNNFEAFRWTEESGLIGLGHIPVACNCFSAAYAVSENGEVIVGETDSSFNGVEAFRWTESQGLVGLGDIGGQSFFASRAYGVSADGSVVVGFDGFAPDAFRWTEETGMLGLGTLPGAPGNSSAYGVSADGTTIVGSSSSISGYQAFYWTSESGMVGLGVLGDGDFYGTANGCSGDGSVIVGFWESPFGREAMIWRASVGMRAIQTELGSDYGLDLSGWQLTHAEGISSDGKTIVGYGINPQGDVEAWIARLPGGGPVLDCDDNGVIDQCELVENDCNSNGTLDSCELEGSDCNNNGVPDDCEISDDDCNSNGILDECDVANGALDFDDNGVLDECEDPIDCNSNGLYDELEFSIDSRVYWTSIIGSEVQSSELNGDDELSVLGGLNVPDFIALDLVHNHIYVTIRGDDVVLRADLDGANVVSVIDNGLSAPTGVAVDPAAGKLYWADEEVGLIWRANLDGTDTEVLVGANGFGPVGLALDVPAGKLYWTDSLSDRIERSNLDGSGIEFVVTTDADPRGLALDPIRNQLYWVTDDGLSIQRCDLDGSNVQTLISGQSDVPNARGIAVDPQAGKFYWSDTTTDRIKRANLDGTDVEEIAFSQNPRGVALAIAALDCNSNGVIDTCEQIEQVDWNVNGYRDADDYAAMTDCLSGPMAVPYPTDAACVQTCLNAFDLDEDGDIDLFDYAILETWGSLP